MCTRSSTTGRKVAEIVPSPSPENRDRVFEFPSSDGESCNLSGLPEPGIVTAWLEDSHLAISHSRIPMRPSNSFEGITCTSNENVLAAPRRATRTRSQAFIVCLLVKLFDRQRNRSGVLHASACRRDHDPVVLLNLLEGGFASATRYRNPGDHAAEQQQQGSQPAQSTSLPSQPADTKQWNEEQGQGQRSKVAPS